LYCGVLGVGILDGVYELSQQPKISAALLARRLKQYHKGDRVRILGGTHAAEILTVDQSANDWVTFKEGGTRDVMSKANIEPEAGFTVDEMNQAERVLRRGA
jgi:hypothetical protein